MSMTNVHISASQLKTLNNCARKHWLQKVAQVPSTQPKRGADRGKLLHSLVESYLQAPPCEGLVPHGFFDFMAKSEHGVEDDETRHGIRSADMNPHLAELRALAHTERSGVKLLVEQEFKMSPVFIGFIDLVVLDRREGDLRVTIHDHKFMSDKRSVLTEDALRSDYQALIYAKVVSEFFGLREVDVEFDYYGTRYKWFSPVRFTLTRDELDVKWEGVLRDTASTLDNYKHTSALQPQPNYLSCGLYGGCEYKTHCFGDTLRSNLSEYL
jgi:hypothetical protein